ncbi:CBS domain-containing protein [Radiobacillus sp. PE A8.2]|uniref:CBS domain-containing protein n=1 Tax=Radiobacillus sp. PE A8.2 TaxID=3380349 RepID=UPI00388DF604
MESITQGERVHRFEAAFNRIHKKLINLKGHSKAYVSYGEALQAAKKLHNVVLYNYDILKQFGRLRNALVHRKVREDFYIAEPHEEIVIEIEKICHLLHEPPIALTVASQPVITFHPKDSLQRILESIKENGFSQFPIYDEHGFCGLLTEGGIAKWLACNIEHSRVSLLNITTADILPYEKKHNVRFLSRESTIYDLEATFEGSFEKNMKLEAILITESGKELHRPIGIVSSWDLVKIDHTTISIASHV